MKHFLFLLFFTMFALGTYAQEDEEQRYTISGHLQDADLKEPMAEATVQLFWANDSSFVGGTLSNEKGNFSIEAPSSGTFRLKISFIGFQTIEREVTLRKNQSMKPADEFGCHHAEGRSGHRARGSGYREKGHVGFQS